MHLLRCIIIVAGPVSWCMAKSIPTYPICLIIWVDSLNLIITNEGLQHMWQKITALRTSQLLWTSLLWKSLHFLTLLYLDWLLMSSCINRAIVCGSGLGMAWDLCVISSLCILIPSWRWILQYSSYNSAFKCSKTSENYRDHTELEKLMTARQPVTAHSLCNSREGGASSAFVLKYSFRPLSQASRAAPLCYCLVPCHLSPRWTD